MKTNHVRDFKARNDKVHRSFSGTKNLPASSEVAVSVRAGFSHGSCKDEAHMKKGAKQFVHTRTRRREDAKMLDTLYASYTEHSVGG